LETVVIVIVGPTCSGKTSLSINLATKLKTEIISADSRQVFKYLDIGTAKSTHVQRLGIRHHLIDYINPDENYNASTFAEEAARIISALHKKGQIPIVVGGSGLYVKALIDGIIDEVEIDEKYRTELLKLRKEFGNEFLYNKLKKVDPESAAKMLPQNWKRVIRALEVYHIYGKPISYFHSVQRKKESPIFKQFGLNWQRGKLYENIDNRVDKMFASGFVREVKNILSKGFAKDLNALNTVGYKEIIQYLEGEISLEEAAELIKRNTRHYAKRQLTWFRKDKRIQWYDINDFGDIKVISEKIIHSLN
jgi:tRNA dimethylallyltransferase